MNVLIISHMYPNSFNENNGIFVHKQVKSMREEFPDINVKVVSPVPYTPFIFTLFSTKYKKYYDIPRKAILDGIEVYYPRAIFLPRNIDFKSEGHKVYKGIKKTVRNIYKDFKFDIIHAHVALPDGYGAMLLNESYNKPLFVTIHGQDMNYTVNFSEECKKRVMEVLDTSYKSIFVSNKLKKDAMKYSDLGENYVVIPNGVDEKDILVEKNDQIREEFKNKRYILTAGNLIQTKGINYAIEAFARIHKQHEDLVLVIIGQGQERENLVELARNKGIEHKVIFKGKLPHKELMQYMKECYFFILPSYKEGFGVVYIEAMAQGKVAIGCKGQGIEDVIENMVDGILVNPKDVDDLAVKMEYVINNDDSRFNMELLAKDKIITKYTWKKSAISLKEQYLEVCK
ncbi:glycosyltransferase [Clostridium sp. UBA1056]|uniref:glycosyltransferase n=1 Tax=unclassified Clostridium TaxID=2614128 RepID=UPI0032168798